MDRQALFSPTQSRRRTHSPHFTHRQDGVIGDERHGAGADAQADLFFQTQPDASSGQGTEREPVRLPGLGERQAGWQGQGTGPETDNPWSHPEFMSAPPSLPAEKLFTCLGANCETLFKQLDARQGPIDPAKIAFVFCMVKNCETAIAFFMKRLATETPQERDAATQRWHAFTTTMGRLLGRLASTLEAGDCRLDGLPLADRASIAMGLGALLDNRRRLFGQRPDSGLAAALATITDRLLAGLDGAGKVDHGRHVGDLLNLFNWVSRGLKAGLLDSGNAGIRAAFRSLLKTSQNWSASQFNARQLGKWFTLFNTIVNFQLADGETPTRQDDGYPGLRPRPGHGGHEHSSAEPPGRVRQHEQHRHRHYRQHQQHPQHPQHPHKHRQHEHHPQNRRHLKDTLAHFFRPAFLALLSSGDPVPLSARAGNVLKDCRSAGLLGPEDDLLWIALDAILAAIGEKNVFGNDDEHDKHNDAGKAGNGDRARARSPVDVSNLANLLRCIGDDDLYRQPRFADSRPTFWQAVDNIIALIQRGALGKTASDTEQSFCNLLSFTKSILRLTGRLQDRENAETGRPRISPEMAKRRHALRRSADRLAGELRAIDWETVRSVAGVAAILSALSWFDQVGMALAGGAGLGLRACLAVGRGRAWRDAEAIAHAARGVLWLSVLYPTQPDLPGARMAPGQTGVLPAAHTPGGESAPAIVRTALINLVLCCAALPRPPSDPSWRLDILRAIRWTMTDMADMTGMAGMMPGGASLPADRHDRTGAAIQAALNLSFGRPGHGGDWTLEDVDRVMDRLAENEEIDDRIEPQPDAQDEVEPAPATASAPRWKLAGETYRKPQSAPADEQAKRPSPGNADTDPPRPARNNPFRQPAGRRRFKPEGRPASEPAPAPPPGPGPEPAPGPAPSADGAGPAATRQASSPVSGHPEPPAQENARKSRRKPEKPAPVIAALIEPVFSGTDATRAQQRRKQQGGGTKGDTRAGPASSGAPDKPASPAKGRRAVTSPVIGTGPRLVAPHRFAALLTTLDEDALCDLLELDKKSHAFYGGSPVDEDPELPALYALVFEEAKRRDFDLSRRYPTGDRLVLVALSLSQPALVAMVVAQIPGFTGWIARKESRSDILDSLFQKADVYSTLTAAVVRGNLSMAEFLIEAGCPVSIKSVASVPPLFEACKTTPDMVALLLKKGADPNDSILQGTSLMQASALGNLDIVKLLISYGVGIDGRSETGETALYYAVGNKREAIAALLLDSNADPHLGPADVTPLAAAIHNGMVGIVRKLLDRGVSTEHPVKTGLGECRPIHLAINRRDAKTVQLLLSHGTYFSRSNRIDRDFFLMAQRARVSNVVRILRDHLENEKLPPDSWMRTVANYALPRFYPFRSISDPIETGRRRGLPASTVPLSTLDDKSLSDMLFARPRQGPPDQTAGADLVSTVLKRLVPVAVELRRRGLSLECRRSHLSPLLAAVTADETEMALALIALKADIESGYLGHTPLIHAAWNNNLTLVTAILEKKPKLDSRCYDRADRFRAIDGAIVKGHAQVVRLLLDHGASFDPHGFPGTDGLRLEDARRRGLTEVVAVLEEHMRRSQTDAFQ